MVPGCRLLAQPPQHIPGEAPMSPLRGPRIASTPAARITKVPGAALPPPLAPFLGHRRSRVTAGAPGPASRTRPALEDTVATAVGRHRRDRHARGPTARAAAA